VIQGLANATLTQVTARGPTGRDGTQTWAAPVTLAARVVLDAPKAAQRTTLGSVIVEATAVLYAAKATLAAAGATAKQGDRVAAAADGSASRAYLVVHVVDRQKAGGLAHLEIFVKE
jgi:hypothetical protein